MQAAQNNSETERFYRRVVFLLGRVQVFHKQVFFPPHQQRIKPKYLDSPIQQNTYYQVSHKKVYLFKTSKSQAPNIAQKKFSTRNESMDILFQKHKFKIL